MAKKLMMNNNYSENGLSPVTDGLICWLDARDVENGNILWTDRSGNGNNGILRGFTFDNQTNGKIGNSLVFDGIECNVLIEIKTSPLFEGNNFSIQANAKIPSHKYSQRLFQKREHTSTYEIMYLGTTNTSSPNVNSVIGNKLQFVSHGFNIDNHGVIANMNVIDNTIKDVSVIANGTHIKLYIDNINVTQRLFDNIVFDDKNPFIGIGSSLMRDTPVSSIGQRSKFKYNSLKIYNRALTDEEILQNYLYEQSIQRE